jgi:hypothetical protein
MRKHKLLLSIPQEKIENKILLVRGLKIMLDSDLAELYGVATKYLVRTVKRNPERFPGDFMFQLTKQEFKNLRCQFGTSRWGGSRYRPYAFTEHGILMLSSLLNSKRAIFVNIQIMRAFIKLREILSTHRELREKIEGHDQQIKFIFSTLRKLMTSPKVSHRKIGFQPS